MTRWHAARAAGAAVVAGVALAGPAAAQPDRVTRFSLEDCAAAEAAVPVPRERVASAVPEPFVPALFPVPAGGTPMVDAFLRLVLCHGDDGRPVRTMWLGVAVREAHARDLRSHVLWRLATDDAELHRVLRAAVPSPRVVLVPAEGFGVRFEELLGAGPDDVPVLSSFRGAVRGTADDLALEWTAPSPHPLVNLPELSRGLRFAWYAPTDSGLRRILTIVPQHGANDREDPLRMEDPVIGFLAGPAEGRLTVSPGSWLAGLLGPEAARDEHGDLVAPASTRYLHVRYHRADQCIEPVTSLANASLCEDE